MRLMRLTRLYKMVWLHIGWSFGVLGIVKSRILEIPLNLLLVSLLYP
jgi:hypothetical protein